MSTSRVFLVKCPKCGNNQKIRIYSNCPLNHKKKCVYCEKIFDVHKGPLHSQIVQEIV